MAAVKRAFKKATKKKVPKKKNGFEIVEYITKVMHVTLGEETVRVHPMAADNRDMYMLQYKCGERDAESATVLMKLGVVLTQALEASQAGIELNYYTTSHNPPGTSHNQRGNKSWRVRVGPELGKYVEVKSPAGTVGSGIRLTHAHTKVVIKAIDALLS